MSQLAAAQELEQHRSYLRGLDIRGRIYLSRQGINAQLSGPVDQALGYARWVASQPSFQASCC